MLHISTLWPTECRKRPKQVSVFHRYLIVAMNSMENDSPHFSLTCLKMLCVVQSHSMWSKVMPAGSRKLEELCVQISSDGRGRLLWCVTKDLQILCCRLLLDTLSFKGRIFLQRKVAKSARIKRLAENVQKLQCKAFIMWYQMQAEMCSSFVVSLASSLQQIRSLHIINHNRCHCTSTQVLIPAC